MNSIWLRLCPLIVLALGLISCKESGKDYPDNFRVQDPTWERFKLGSDGHPLPNSKTEQSFQETAKVLTTRNLGDSLVFREPSVDLIVSSRCTDNRMPAEAIKRDSTLFANVKSVSLASMLPEQVLYPNFLIQTKAVRCSLKISVINSIGSVHKLQMEAQPIEDDSEQIYSIDWKDNANPTAPQGRSFDLESLVSTRMFSVTPETNVAPAFLCITQTAPPTPREVKLKMLNEKFLYGEISAEKDIKGTTTKCRTVGRKNGVVAIYSRTFDVAWRMPQLEAAPPPKPNASINGDGLLHTGRY